MFLELFLFSKEIIVMAGRPTCGTRGDDRARLARVAEYYLAHHDTGAFQVLATAPPM